MHITLFFFRIIHCMRRFRHVLLISTLAVALAGPVCASGQTTLEMAPSGGLMRFPDVSATHVVFLYANNLWLVPRAGGTASPVAGPAGVEMYPRFSPDGSLIAFVGNYQGDSDLYVIPTAGGVPKRVTHHPGYERLCDWTPDGRLVYASSANSFYPRVLQLYSVSSEGGLPEQLAIPWGASAALHSDGRRVAYTPYSRDNRTWKRYMGGLADDIWLFDLEEKTGRRLTDWDGTDSFPMWNGDTLFFLSDAGPNHRLNIWSLDLSTGERMQRTFFENLDVRFPAMGPGCDGKGEIVFQCGDQIWLMDLVEYDPKALDIRVPGDRPRLQARHFDVSDAIQGWGVGPTGSRAVVQARGDIWTAPAKNGSPRNLTQSDGIAERNPAWSPDGQWLAYFSDKTGEYELYITQSDGLGETRQLTSGGDAFCWWPQWSPDSQWIAYGDKTGRLWLCSVETLENRQVIKEPTAWRNTDGVDIAWSPDSRTLVFSAVDGEERLSSLWAFEIGDGSIHRLTSGAFQDSQPVFDPEGRYLYFSSSRSFSPTYSDLDTSFVYRQSELLMMATLREDVEDPFSAETDEEEWKKEASGKEKSGADKEADAWSMLLGAWTGTLPEGRGEYGGIEFKLTLCRGGQGQEVKGTLLVGQMEGRISGTFDHETLKLDLKASFERGPKVSGFLDLEENALSGVAYVGDEEYAVKAERADDEEEEEEKEDEDLIKIDYAGFESRVVALPIARGRFANLAVNDKNQLLFRRTDSVDGQVQEGVKIFDPADDSPEEKMVTTERGSFQLSADRKKLLLIAGDTAKLFNAAAGASGESVTMSPMLTRIDPMAEWKQVFRDTWRIMRDFFYDPNMHGVDWQGVYDRYAPMVDECASREDVQYLIGEVIAELNVGHAYLGGAGADAERADSRNVGLLGCDYAIENGRFRIRKIYSGAPWDTDARGPLGRPGMDVKEGDYLLAVNGVTAKVDQDPYSYFIGLAGRETTITVNESPEIDGNERLIAVVPVGSESELRYRHWIEETRRYVSEKTGGAVGYIYVPNTGRQGQNDLVRQYVGQLHKDALIIDERWNGGGQIPTRFIELLNRPVTNYWAVRDGRDWTWPPDAHHGPKCMLINGPAGSGGDAFPHYFRQAGLGKLIGTRTWGGLVGLSGNPALIDGGRITVPTFAFYETDGTWGIEGYGVAPDIEVEADPTILAAGRDPQLEAAIAHMLEMLEKAPYRKPERPAYPDRTGMGIPEEER